MTKRTVTSVLWFLAVWTVGNIASTFAGIPSVVGPGAGLLVAALLWWDPAGWFWSPRTRTTPAMRRRLADLERVSEPAPEPRVSPQVEPAPR